MSELSKIYDPRATEPRWYRMWLEAGYFHADEDREGPSFSVVIPPPNVTGMLTMGHVLNNTLQDIVVRYHRMQGENALWMPGTDHAGIATQNVVEKQLAKEGTNRHELGRERFLERVWAWKEQYGGTILRQLQSLGCSCDWQRERFTMDEGLSSAVREVFVRLYEKGLIYRGNRIIHWCVRCHTALSDEEAVTTEGGEEGHLWHIRYPAADGGPGVIVATTRPETMLGDTGVAVHPADERYRELLGRQVTLPLMDRPIPVVADELVDPEFGTGAVKVTPAHDANDFEMGNRHGLEAIRIMDIRGRINDNGGPYAGLSRDEARQRVVADLKERGLLVKTDPYRVPIRRCQRCDTVIEPYLSEQWFVKMAPLAKPAVEALSSGRLRLIPERWNGVYLHWLENIRDWCISRQLWWGHRIPVWYCDDCGKETVARTDPTACAHCSSASIRQDPDVLDTWFSSWLWPFSTMGWPQNTPTLQRFYPTDMLATGADIIFFWVARMVMAGYEFLGDCPFHEVYFNSIVRDETGRKMSKSLGNSPDPLKVIEHYGADALRYTMIALAPVGQDVRYGEKKTELGRNFANKLWNVTRFALMNLGDAPIEVWPETSVAQLDLPDRWILSRLDGVTATVRAALDSYRFNDAATLLYRFARGEFCDWYIELVKPVLYQEDTAASENTRRTLVTVLDRLMRLLHPIMPFLTEEIWQALPVVRATASIMIAAYPEAHGAWHDPAAETAAARLIATVTAVRNIRMELGIAPTTALSVHIAADARRDAVRELEGYIKRMARVTDLGFIEGTACPAGEPSAVVEGVGEVFVPLGSAVDAATVRGRLERDLAKVEKELGGVEAKLARPAFAEKAPREIVEKERGRATSLRERRLVLQRHRAAIGARD